MQIKKARKKWVCDWCGEAIPKGAEYASETTYKGDCNESPEGRQFHLECFKVIGEDAAYAPRKQRRGFGFGENAYDLEAR